MKPTLKNKNSGFTLIELLVVIAILGMMSTLVVVNFNKLRAQRSVVLAENEMVSQIRKAQAYSLSGRDTKAFSNGSPRYFVVNFNRAVDFYSIAELVQVNGSLQYNEIEVLKFNDGANISAFSTLGQGGVTPACAQVIFSVPYGRTYIYTSDDVCDDSILSIVNDPLQLSALANRKLQMTLSNPKTSTTKNVTVLGVTNRIEGN